jgi:hypothetical protein
MQWCARPALEIDLTLLARQLAVHAAPGGEAEEMQCRISGNRGVQRRGRMIR